MIAADTSFVVAAFASWHQSPPPHRAPADVVSEFLAERFPEGYLVLDSAPLKALMKRLPGLGITGGAAYDAAIGATAAHAGATLELGPPSIRDVPAQRLRREAVDLVLNSSPGLGNPRPELLDEVQAGLEATPVGTFTWPCV